MNTLTRSGPTLIDYVSATRERVERGLEQVQTLLRKRMYV